MFLLELHRALEADRRRETRAAARRAAMLEALDAESVDGSNRVARVSLDDGAGRRGDSGPDLGRVQDLDPASGPEHRQRRLVRPVQAQPKS